MWITPAQNRKISSNKVDGAHMLLYTFWPYHSLHDRCPIVHERSPRLSQRRNRRAIPPYIQPQSHLSRIFVVFPHTFLLNLTKYPLTSESSPNCNNALLSFNTARHLSSRSRTVRTECASQNTLCSRRRKGAHGNFSKHVLRASTRSLFPNVASSIEFGRYCVVLVGDGGYGPHMCVRIELTSCLS
jgi:hypothetical protein